MRVCTIFDKKSRPDTVGVYIDNALMELGYSVHHVNPVSGHEQKVIYPADAYILVDDGFSYSVGASPVAYWAIDTHIDMQTCLLKAKEADYVFAAQKDGAKELAQLSGKDVQWLPLACDPMVHYEPGVVEKKHDICFIGSVSVLKEYEGRVDFLDKMFRKYDFFHGNRFFEDCTLKYGESKIVLNYAIKDDINMRVFEAMASGSLLITNEVSYLGDIFPDLPTFQDTKGAMALVDYYLQHEEEREKLARGLQQDALKHTYYKRVKKIMEAFDASSHRLTGTAGSI